jgi:uncharacterized protein YjbI with pentapeptide repeats
MAAPRKAPTVDEPDLATELTELGAIEIDEQTSIEDALVTGMTAADDPFEGLTMSGCRLSGVELTGATLRNVTLVDVRLEDCELSGTTFDFATFERVRFERCRMSGFVAPQLEARHTTFSECRMDQAWFRLADLERCSFEDCDLSDADFYTARVAASRFVRTRLDGSEWSAASLDDVALHGSTFEGVQGADALRNLVIGSDQVVPLAFPVFGALSIVVDDDYLADELPGRRDLRDSAR